MKRTPPSVRIASSSPPASVSSSPLCSRQHGSARQQEHLGHLGRGGCCSWPLGRRLPELPYLQRDVRLDDAPRRGGCVEILGLCDTLEAATQRLVGSKTGSK